MELHLHDTMCFTIICNIAENYSQSARNVVDLVHIHEISMPTVNGTRTINLNFQLPKIGNIARLTNWCHRIYIAVSRKYRLHAIRFTVSIAIGVQLFELNKTLKDVLNRDCIGYIDSCSSILFHRYMKSVEIYLQKMYQFK